jgi:hypothetical protein
MGGVEICMASSDRTNYSLIGDFLYWLGYDRLEERFSFMPHPLIFYGILFVFMGVFGVQIPRVLIGYKLIYLTNPSALINPTLTLIPPFVIVYLHKRYNQVLEHIDVESRTSKPEVFDNLAPKWLQLGLYSVFILNAVYQFGIKQGIDKILQVGGIPELFGVLILLPLGQGVIISEFMATYAGILLFFPRKIRKTDFKINFLDPEGLGGLRPVGELMKSAYYFLMLGLIASSLALYGPSIITGESVSQYGIGFLQELLFTLAWLLAIGLVGYGLAQIHWFMKREKRKELTKLDKKAREIVDKPFEIQNLEISDQEKYEELRMRMDYINNTREYPTTFTMWVQLSIGVILPKAIQMLLSTV